METDPETASDIADPRGTAKPSGLRRARGILTPVLVLAIVAAVGYAVWKDRHDFAATLREVGVPGLLLSLVFALVGVGATALQWRAVLAGLDIQFGVRETAKVFFVSQLGKYLPGSVWPIVVQMEAGKARGASRTTVAAANLITLMVSFATGLGLAAVLLPFSLPSALHRFWWALAALPVVLLLLYPPLIPYLLDWLLKLVRRQPFGVRMTVSATVRAAAWSCLSWLGLGLSVFVLAAAGHRAGVGLAALCIGGMGLAVSAGVLFIPAPAGAGMREIVLGYVLVAALTSGEAVAIVVASRVILICADLLLAALAVLFGRSHPLVASQSPALPERT